MIEGFIGTPVPLAVNFLPSRTGLSTVGYTVLDQNGGVLVPRTTGAVVEVVAGSGMYRTSRLFTEAIQGFVLWDTGQSGVGLTALRRAIEEIWVHAVPAGDNTLIIQTVDDIKDAVSALFEENTIKIPNGIKPTQMRIIRKRSQDPNWVTPYSDAVVHIVREVGLERYGGPAP
jgi:hypothetical protein